MTRVPRTRAESRLQIAKAAAYFRKHGELGVVGGNTLAAVAKRFGVGQPSIRAEIARMKAGAG